MTEQYRIIHPVKYYRDHLKKKIRPDGREFNKFRPIALNVGSVTTADGSAIVKIGNTTVLSTIKAQLAKPKAEEPDCGFLIPNVELTSFCHPKYRTGATEDAEVYSSIIYDVLMDANVIDLKELCIHKEKLVWCLSCFVTCLNHDGCIIDAAIISIISALKILKLPRIEYDAQIDKITTHVEDRNSLDIKAMPISSTFMIFDNKIIITDPTSEEESLSSSMLTIAVCNSEVCFIFKPGGTPLGQEEMDTCMERALLREKSVLELIKNVTRKKKIK